MQSCAEISRLPPNRRGRRIVALIGMCRQRYLLPTGVCQHNGCVLFSQVTAELLNFFTGRVIIEQAVEFGAVFPNVLHDLGQIT